MNLYFPQGQFDLTRETIACLLPYFEKNFGPNSSWALFLTKILGVLCLESNAQKGIDLLQRILESHVDDYQAINGLVILYARQQKWEDAESLLERSIAKTSTSDQSASLGLTFAQCLIYAEKGMYQELEQRCLGAIQTAQNAQEVSLHVCIRCRASSSKHRTYNWVITGFQATFGFFHYETLEHLCKLGITYSKAGKAEAAEEALQKALKSYEELLGPDQPATIACKEWLGVSYAQQQKAQQQKAQQQKKHTQAWLRKVLDDYHRSPEDEHTLARAFAIGFAFDQNGYYQDAEDMFQIAFTGRHKLFGESDRTRWSLALRLRICISCKDDGKRQK
ncbi:tetratricopeptide repeat protein [Aspergillus tanneri]|uniref:MalT-like TPR region domain-containing protein n=1 Tax=Aspergillus tanneri TaxID=1220188 RepID=A0A5M9ND76_9EURO|nr:uncharacterized protein ATNIH1004_001532 [Aspergillus tanneri]KAA8652627.1 hypothetical protein ATNIH1004_001532 [Aspergillus tanneri]